MSPRRHQERFSRLIRHLRHHGTALLPLPVGAGQVTLLPDGPHFFEALFNDLNNAQQLICLEYYRIRADLTGQRFADLLIEAAARGVKVFLLYDAIGCHVTPDSYFQRLQTAGVSCLAFNPFSLSRIHWFDRRNHRKLALIDNRVAYLGGLNISDAYAGLTDEQLRFRDVGFSLGGAALAALQELFADTWALERGKRPELPAPTIHNCTPDDTEVTLINGGPHQRRSAIRTAFRVSMASASHELLIANPYFIPGPRILRSLLRAAKRGVRVRLLLPARTDVPVVRVVSRGYYEVLLKAGIEIYELERQLLHAKLMLIDGEQTVIGSANLDQRSFHRNFEINAIVRSQSFGTQVHRLFEQDFDGSRRITLDGHSRRGLGVRLLELLLRPISWFL